jgi:hypothetical protein
VRSPEVLGDPLRPGADAHRDRGVERRAANQLPQNGRDVGLAEGGSSGSVPLAVAGEVFIRSWSRGEGGGQAEIRAKCPWPTTSSKVRER